MIIFLPVPWSWTGIHFFRLFNAWFIVLYYWALNLQPLFAYFQVVYQAHFVPQWRAFTNSPFSLFGGFCLWSFPVCSFFFSSSNEHLFLCVMSPTSSKSKGKYHLYNSFVSIQLHHISIGGIGHLDLCQLPLEAGLHTLFFKWYPPIPINRRHINKSFLTTIKTQNIPNLCTKVGVTCFAICLAFHVDLHVIPLL